MKYEILAVEWRSGRHTVGFVAYKTYNDEWCAVVGYSPEGRIFEIHNTLYMSFGTQTPEGDAQYIASHGAKLSWKEAQAFFPQLDIKKYKYYPDELKNKANDNKNDTI